MPSSIFKLLFFGDLVGKPGRKAVVKYLEEVRMMPREQQPDAVIANVENVSHGFGLMPQHYKELRNAGVDIMTGGNHIWDRKELLPFIEEADRLVRPANMPYVPGVGSRVFEINGFKIGVLNLMGQVFMGNYNSPWEAIDIHLPKLKAETPLVFLDFHAETTAEKSAMAHYAAKMGLSAMSGTHTHVQTADDQILYDQLGYLTDAGFNGSYQSLIGFEPEGSIGKLRTHLPSKLDIAEAGYDLQVNGVYFSVDGETGRCLSVERVQKVYPSKH